jgi:RHS repeat-associated protein
MEAAQEHAFRGSGSDPCMFFPLAAFEGVAENSRLGFARKNPAPHQGSAWSNSASALGMPGVLLETRVGSRYTGKERDTESGNDYFGARYYASSMGRFLSPDWSDKPEAVPYADLSNPQTLNLYSYGRNNPLSVTDPDGHCTSGGDQKGFWWCLFHYSDQDALAEAKGFFNNNAVYQNGSRVDPSKMTDQQLLAAWKGFNDQWKAIAATGANPGAVMAGAAIITLDKLQHIYDLHAGDFGLSWQ